MKNFAKFIAMLLISIIAAFSLYSCGGGEEGVTVSFIIDGELYHTATADSILDINAPHAPSRDDQSFVGWFLDDATFELEFEPNNIHGIEEKEISVYAKYEYTSHHHTPSDWITVREATCAVSGIRKKICTDEECGEQIAMEFTDQLAHSEGEWTVSIEPTCKREGEEITSCTFCGAHLNSRKVDVLTEHTPNNAVKENKIAANCQKEGSYDLVIYCAICEIELSREGKIDEIKEHTPTEAVKENEVAADCKNEGSYDLVTYCSVCETELSREGKIDEIKEHTPAEAVKENEIAADCQKEGGYDLVVYCSVCETELSREGKIDEIKDHTPAEAVKENEISADCKNEGSYDLVTYCSVCETELSREGKIDEIKEHTPAEAVKENEIAADCKNEGSYDLVVYCSVCETELSREKKIIETNPHTPAEAVKENEIAADCKNEGSYDLVIYCSVCETELSREKKIIETNPHTPAEAVRENEIAADCKNEGSYDLVVYCSVCESELSREKKIIEINPNDHDEKLVTGYDSTDVSDGLTDGIICNRCGEVIDAQEIIPARIQGVNFNDYDFEAIDGKFVYNAKSYDVTIRELIKVYEKASFDIYSDESCLTPATEVITLSELNPEISLYLKVNCGEDEAVYEITFKITVYTVTFDTDCKLGVFEVRIIGGNLITGVSTPFRSDSWSFEGWYIKDTDIEWNTKTDIVTGDMILVAHWSIMTPPDIW